jgi:hemolysin activation/secretion protein
MGRHRITPRIVPRLAGFGGLAIWTTLAVFAAPASAQLRGPMFPVSAFEVDYALEHPRHLPIQQILDLEVGLRSTVNGYVAPRPVDRTVRMRLSSLPRNASFSASAIQHINQFIVSTFNRNGIDGVIVTVPEIDEETGRDLRPPGRTRLLLRIWTARIQRLTTVADGERFEGLSTDERTNLAAHAWIRERAPVQPGGERDLLVVKALEDYAARVSRHPGRRVDVELSPGDRPGTTDVNLRVAESKTWYVYAQYSNTGTIETTKNRERFGFVHNQLLGRDDILTIDYTTGDFDSPQSVIGSYDSPFLKGVDAWRFRVRGWYSQFDASTVGFSDGRFFGEQYSGDAALVHNFYQDGELFVDAELGFAGQQMYVENYELPDENGQVPSTGRGTYFLPSVGIAGDRLTRTTAMLFGTFFEAGLTNTPAAELAILGRQDPSTDFLRLRWDGSYSFYLEPLIDRQAWEDPTTPRSSTLAHEIALLFRGQYPFGARLVPQYQQIAGGLYTVRGYNQAEVAGDTVVIGSAEYRLHVPRLFSPDPNPPEVPGMGVFRARPQTVFGRPDWDLVFRVFTDAAGVFISAPDATETNSTLWSVGGGVELQVLRNLSARVDVGTVLTAAGRSTLGDTRANVVATVLY